MTTRIDGHQHFWTLNRGDYDWLTPNLAPIYSDFTPADLKPLLDQAEVTATVVVQAAATIDETRYLLKLAYENAFIAGVVGWVDMADVNAIDVLAEFSQHAKFVGIRAMIENIDDPKWIRNASLKPVIRYLADNRICLDALVKSVHLPHLLEVLRQHPDLQTVIDHGAKPDIANNAWQPWADQMTAIARQTSAYCKLSGLITEASDLQSYDHVMPYMDHLLEAFGPDRLIWGSDWPVLKLAGDYIGWHNAFQQWLTQLPEHERSLVEGENAVRFYGLEGY